MEKETVKPNREYRDSVFVDLFSRQGAFSIRNIISLYNALHDEKIDEKTIVKFVYLANVLYHKLKNDVSCIIDGKILVLIEHQSTINENMPLRCLEYVVELYKQILDSESKYGKRLIKIPTPEFYVLYNGTAEYKAREILYLSKSFMQEQKDFKLELKVEVININHSDNKEFLSSCEILKEYKEFVDKVVEYTREYGKGGFDMAIEYCINHGILEPYLKENSKEVRNMLTTEYNYETELRVVKREAREEGINEGIRKGRMEGMMEGRMEGREEGLVTTATRMKNANCEVGFIQQMTGLSREVIEKL